MRVAFVSQPMDSVVFNQNSIGIWTLEASTRLGCTHDVRVYCRADTTNRRVEGVELCRISLKPDTWLNRIARKLLSGNAPDRPYFSSWTFFFLYAVRVAIDLRSFRPDIIHLHNFSQFAPLIKTLNPHSRLVLHMHCEWLTQLDETIVRSRLGYVDTIAGCSTYITDAIAKRFPGHARKCATIYNGVDSSRFSPAESPDSLSAESRTRLLFVGRVSPEKGLHYLVDALPALSDRIENFTLDIIGSKRQLPYEYLGALSEEALARHLSNFYGNDDRSYYYEFLTEKIRSLGLEQSVNFHGQLPQSDLPDFYRKADVLINPSLSESFGMSLIEAMACGVPVIATDVGGMAEIVQNRITGLIVPHSDPDALSDGIGHLVSDPDSAGAMGKAGRRRAKEHYSWDKIVADLESSYRSACA
ncbi:MAG: glycosyltransferase family 4 protein [Pseudomonadota bacterium]|nr:glycosyltransferase family 4 protein [Pseudomonadota bacterium]